MIGPPAGVRVYLAASVTDMGRGPIGGAPERHRTMIFIDTELGRYVRSPFTAALAISFLAMPAFAQKQDEQLWIEFNASTVLSEGVKLELETNQRISNDLGGLYESQYLAAVGVEIAKGVTLTGGVNRVVAVDNGKVSSTDWRPRQEIGFPIAALGRGKLAGRVRFEQRFRSDGNDVGHRVRPEISFTRPLTDILKVRLAHESYLNLNTTDFGQDAGHERMRNSAAILFPITAKVNAEVGYMNQYRFNGEARDLMEHALNTSLSIRF
jgi:hypothetical protein